MRQILQNLGNGETMLAEVPRPKLGQNDVLVASQCSLISIGTERMLLEFGRSSLVGKARKQPAKVRQVLNKIKTDGLAVTVEAVRSKLGQPIPLGYSNAGIVLEVGGNVRDFAPGDRVASNGPHAEVVRVGRNLCAAIPDGVPFDQAAFAVVASIGLQGVRLAAPTLGETVVVIGLGLIGLLTVQLLKSNGCKVIGLDPDGGRCALAREFGAEAILLGSKDPVKTVLALTNGFGADAVLITASTTSDEPIRQAAAMSRKRGRIVLVGVAGLNLSRELFYEKELSFQVSCSYGPGRYDPDYEERGIDYPAGFVRWTEKRNFEAVLGLMASGAIDPSRLITARHHLEDAVDAYRGLAGSSLGVLIDYKPVAENETALSARTIRLSDEPGRPASAPGTLVAGFLGFGNFGSRTLAPMFKAAGVELKTVVNSGGAAASVTGKSAGFSLSSTDSESIFADPHINTVAIVTRHDSHAGLAARAVASGKAVFVEKPLAITRQQLTQVRDAVQAATSEGLSPIVTVGFNRRCAPMILKMKTWLDRRNEPVSLMLTMNAGAVPAAHWTQDPEIGGGRIIGEAIHYIDLARFLAGQPITEVRALGMGMADGSGSDKTHIVLCFADGSTAVINYLANGSPAYPKERIEAFCEGGTVVIDNFRTLKAYSAAGVSSTRAWRPDKGHAAFVRQFVEAVKGSTAPPMPFDEIIEVHDAAFTAIEQIRA